MKKYSRISGWSDQNVVQLIPHRGELALPGTAFDVGGRGEERSEQMGAGQQDRANRQGTLFGIP